MINSLFGEERRGEYEPLSHSCDSSFFPFQLGCAQNHRDGGGDGEAEDGCRAGEWHTVTDHDSTMLHHLYTLILLITYLHSAIK